MVVHIASITSTVSNKLITTKQKKLS